MMSSRRAAARANDSQNSHEFCCMRARNAYFRAAIGVVDLGGQTE